MKLKPSMDETSTKEEALGIDEPSTMQGSQTTSKREV